EGHQIPQRRGKHKRERRGGGRGSRKEEPPQLQLPPADRSCLSAKSGACCPNLRHEFSYAAPAVILSRANTECHPGKEPACLSRSRFAGTCFRSNRSHLSAKENPATS